MKFSLNFALAHSYYFFFYQPVSSSEVLLEINDVRHVTDDAACHAPGCSFVRFIIERLFTKDTAVAAVAKAEERRKKT